MFDWLPDAAGGVAAEHGVNHQAVAVAIGEGRQRGGLVFRFGAIANPSISVGDQVSERVRPGFRMAGRQMRIAARGRIELGGIFREQRIGLRVVAQPQLVGLLLPPRQRRLAAVHFQA